MIMQFGTATCRLAQVRYLMSLYSTRKGVAGVIHIGLILRSVSHDSSPKDQKIEQTPFRKIQNSRQYYGPPYVPTKMYAKTKATKLKTKMYLQMNMHFERPILEKI